jgi:hypothetical protein
MACRTDPPATLPADAVNAVKDAVGSGKDTAKDKLDKAGKTIKEQATRATDAVSAPNTDTLPH